MAVASDWIKHLGTEEERKEFAKSVSGASHVLERLADIIDEKIAGLDHEEMSSKSYENPSWAYKQAHINGERNGLTKIKNLLQS